MNKKAQIGETMTWMVGTIVVIVILAIAIFIVSSRIFENERSIGLKDTKTDLLVTKSFLAYLLTDDIYNQLKTSQGLNGENCELAKNVLKIYEEQYPLDRFAIIYDENNRLDYSECFFYSISKYYPTIETFGTWCFIRLNENKKLGIYVARESEYVVEE